METDTSDRTIVSLSSTYSSVCVCVCVRVCVRVCVCVCVVKVKSWRIKEKCTFMTVLQEPLCMDQTLTVASGDAVIATS